MNRENFKVYKVNIIGAGFSGLVTAISLASRFKGEDIVLRTIFLRRDHQVSCLRNF